VSLWRLDAIKGAAAADEDDFETDRGIVENTLERAIPLLEKHAGVTLAELGLDSYFTRPKSPDELVADVAAFKEANLRDLAAFTGAEPVTDQAEYELLSGKLRRMLVAWTAIEALDAQEDEDPVRVALNAVAETAEKEIADLPADSLAVAAAKLIVARLYDFQEPDSSEDSWTDEGLLAQSALKAIEWFGLKDLLDAYDAARAPAEKEAVAS
jgi:hypothetical protein